MKRNITDYLSKCCLALAVCCFSFSGYAISLEVAEIKPVTDLEAKGPSTTEETSTTVVSPLEITVRGTVTGPEGETLPGVTVRLKQAPRVGTVTDLEGNYTLNVPDEFAQEGTLVFSFVGFEERQEPINNRSVIDVTLSEDIQALEEVVVIGYQTVKKKDLTGATSVVSTEAAERVTAASVAESIQGLAPGVSVRNGGAPGQGAAIEIRGVSSFSNTNPLYVIDGMIADANPTINTNDIASIQILKDASAAAIYGSRAANGVIIITTKQGREGPARVSFSAKYGIQQIPKRWDVMNNVEFAEMQRRQYRNSGLEPLPSVSDEFDPAVNTDWQEETIRLGNMQDYNLSLSGGTENSKYLVSGSYFKNTGVLIGNEFERGALRINTSSTKGRVTFGENLVLTNSVVRAPGEGNPFYDMPQMLPVIRVQGPEYVTEDNPLGWGRGTPDAITYAWNPVAVANILSNRSNFAKLVGNAYVDVDIADWLKYRFNAGAEVSFDYIRFMRREGEWHFNQPAAPTRIVEDRSRFLNLLFEHTLNFNRAFGDHEINGVVGYSQQSTRRDITSAGRTELASFNGQYLNTVNAATGEAIAHGWTPDNYLLYGYLGRFNYTYDDRYLLTLTGRYDTDSRFGEGNRSGFFPSVAAGWRISEEDFFNVNWVSNLKLRASYGELGIVTVGSWDYTAFLNNNPRAIFGPDQDPFVGAIQAQLANPDLGWERRISRNIGFDAGLFENRLAFTVELYENLSEDVLVRLPVAWYTGNLGGDPFVNAASIRNRGVEMEATYVNRGSDFQWELSGNLTTIQNRVVDVGDRPGGINYIQTGLTRSQEGRPVGEWYVLQTAGLFQSQEEVEEHVNSEGELIQPDAQPGDIRFVDQNDDGTINQEDRTFVDSPWPTLQTGAQFNASYQQFSLNIQLVGVFGHTVLNGVRAQLDAYQNTNFRRGIDPWSPENPGGTDPRIGVAIGDPALIDNARLESDRWLEDASYLRLRNIEIGYSLPQALLDRFELQRARFYLSGQNLFTLTGYSGLDPDVTGAGILERGFDAGNWPASRVISIGLQCEF